MFHQHEKSILSSLSCMVRSKSCLFDNSEEAWIIPQNIKIGIIGYKIEILKRFHFGIHGLFESVN